MTFVLKDIGELLTMGGPSVRSSNRADRHEAAEYALGRIENAVLMWSEGIVLYAGSLDDAPPLHLLPQPVTVQSACGLLVTPGLCDPHTHLLWAGDRSDEFEKRGLGQTYLQIAAQGGGIQKSVRETTAATDETLKALLHKRLSWALSLGTTFCEVKTGYGLAPDAELRLLRLMVEVAGEHPCAVSPTFLCHVPPKEAASGADRARFLRDLVQVLPTAKQFGAHALDVYCDVGAFSLAETRELLRAGQEAGLFLRCHAEQFTHTGAAALAASLGALSVEHLEQIDAAGRAALAQVHANTGRKTVANLLPGAALQLKLPWPDGAALLDEGLEVALGTDCNPGSSLCLSQPLMMSLACTYMGLSCAEAWLAVTRNAALSIGPSPRQPDRGRLTQGASADVVLWNAQHYREVCQQLGGNPVRSVWAGGQALFF